MKLNTSRMSGIVPAFFGMFLLVMFAAPSAQRGRRGGADANTGLPIATNTILQNPDAYYGKPVTVSAAVEQMLSKTAFLIDQRKAAGASEVKAIGKPILVIAPYLTSTLDQNNYLLIRGEIIRFDPQAIAKVAADYKLDLAFDAAVFSKPLLFVGNQLISAADFLEQMRDKVGDNFDFITGIMTPAKAQQAIFDAFGSGGLNWLQDRTNDMDNVVNVNDIVITNTANAVGFAMTLTMPATTLDIPIDLDFALPGLGLKLDAKANVQFGFTMPPSFGISTTQGVYIDNSSFDNMTASLTASLPTPPDASGFKGWLGTMPYRITEQTSTTTRLTGNIDVTIHDPNTDGKLSLNELTASLGAAIRPTDASTQTAANALISGGFSSTSNGVHLHLKSDLPTGAVVPRYQMDLDITNWNYAAACRRRRRCVRSVQFELVSFMRDSSARRSRACARRSSRSTASSIS